MTTKKVYYYDYRATATSEPAQTKPVAPPTESKLPPPQTHIEPPPPAPAMEPSLAYPASRGRSRFLSLALIIILVVAIAYLVYSLLPQDYQACVNFLGSKTTQTYPGSCTTFYRQTFIQSTETPAPLTSDNETPFETNLSVTPALGPTGFPAQSGATTKGGIPVAAPSTTPKAIAKTPTPTSKPSGTPGSSSDASNSHPSDWIKHRYPNQNFSLYLPPRFTSTNVTHNVDTNISTFTIYDGNTPVIQVAIQPNWDNTGNAKSQGITFMLGDTGVIKVVNGSQSTYYFEKNNQVYIFTCTIDSQTCDTIIKSIQFS